MTKKIIAMLTLAIIVTTATAIFIISNFCDPNISLDKKFYTAEETADFN